MRFHHLERRAWLVPLALVIGVASCDVSTSPGSYYVTYFAVTTGAGTIDSVYYLPSSGKCTTVCSADSTYNKSTSGGTTFEAELTTPVPATLEAHLWGHGTATGTATFKVIWTTATGAVSGDSVQTATSSGAAFTLDLAKKTI